MGYLLDPRYAGEGIPNKFRNQFEEEIYAHHLSDNQSPSIKHQEQMYKEHNSSWRQDLSGLFLTVSRTTVAFAATTCKARDLYGNVSAVSKRNFSTFGFIHSKLTNCFSPEAVMKLVYIKINNGQFCGPAIEDDESSDLMGVSNDDHLEILKIDD